MNQKLNWEIVVDYKINLDHVNKNNIRNKWKQIYAVTVKYNNRGGDHKVKPKVKVESVYIRNFYD